jgi:heme exporter protein A
MTTEPTAATCAVETRGLGRRFGRLWALSHLDLEVAAGETVMLAGSNGSGKTTLLRLIAGLLRPTRGEVTVFGKDSVRDRIACRRDVAVVSHHSYLYDRLTALEITRIWARLLGLSTADEDLLEHLAEVGLADRSEVAVGGFSAGMRKRLTLLRARLKRPRLVLFDEPFSALDRQGQNLVEEWMQSFRASGVALIVASHDLERASELCDRAVLLRQGQRVWSGPAPRVLEKF